MLPRFAVSARLRPVSLVASEPQEVAGWRTLAPYVAMEALPGSGPLELSAASGEVVLGARFDAGRVLLRVTTPEGTTHHRSRRHGRARRPVEAVAIALTGPWFTAFTREDGAWVARGRAALRDRLDVHDEGWLAGLRGHCEGEAAAVRAGGFGALGLRDIRLVTHADGSAYRLPDGRLLLTATSAGPGFFDTAHTSVWAFEPAGPALEHRADLFFRRPDLPGAYGDHATHLVRDGDKWLVATSTWGNFDTALPDPTVAVTLAEATHDVTVGRHLLDTRALDLPTPGLASVGVWDPHLVRAGEGWLVGYVSARRFFDFHPVVAGGPSLGSLTLRGAASDRRATEGTTLARLGGQWRVLASDGRDNRRGRRAAYPVFDLSLRQVGSLEADYPSNIPWPTLVPDGDGWVLVGFDGTPYGGRLLGYGTHGDVVIQRPLIEG